MLLLLYIFVFICYYDFSIFIPPFSATCVVAPVPQCLAPVATARRSTKDQVPVTLRRVIRSCQRCGRGCQRCEGLMERQAEAWHFHNVSQFHDVSHIPSGFIDSLFAGTS